MKWRVLVSAPYLLPAIEEFRSRFTDLEIEVVATAVKERINERELFPLVGAIDGIICGDDELTEKVLRRAPRLKVIAKWGTGIDSIDVRAAAKLGIRVYNTPNAFTDAVADSVLGYLLCFARQIPQMNEDVRGGKWIKRDAVSLGECTLGIIGIGNIGKAVARRARAFGMNILGNDIVPIADSFAVETGLVAVPLCELLEKSDFVTLHCDLNPTSRHLIDCAELALMRSDSYLINTSRGSVVNESALIDALKNNRIAGAALDVFEVEPLPANSPLLFFDNCLLAPHNSNSSPAAKRRVHESTIANLLRGLREAENENGE